MSDLTNDIADVLNTVADKVKEYSEYAKIAAQIKAEEAKKQELYYRLGKKYYELYKDAPASDLTEITDKLVACDEKIEGFQEALKEARNAGYTDVNADPDAEESAEPEVTEEVPADASEE